MKSKNIKLKAIENKDEFMNKDIFDCILANCKFKIFLKWWYIKQKSLFFQIWIFLLSIEICAIAFIYCFLW